MLKVFISLMIIIQFSGLAYSDDCKDYKDGLMAMSILEIKHKGNTKRLIAGLWDTVLSQEFIDKLMSMPSDERESSVQQVLVTP